MVLGVEHFNRPNDRGRKTAVLIFLDHAFEMLFKACIVARGGKIRRSKERETIGFDQCIRVAQSNARISFLTTEQALVAQTVNSLRDAAQHYLIDVSESRLYIHAQSAVTLFRDVLGDVFNLKLSSFLSGRVLPISTIAPTDLTVLFDQEITEIMKLLKPGKRKRIEGYARLRSLAILDATIRGEALQPTPGELRRYITKLQDGMPWNEVFLGVASIQVTAEGSGPTLALRFSKKKGMPFVVVPEGTPGASVVGQKRVNELTFYNLGRDQLAAHVGLSTNRTTAVIWYGDIQNDPDCFKEIQIGKMKFKRYSQKAIDRVKSKLQCKPMEGIWGEYKAHLRQKRMDHEAHT